MKRPGPRKQRTYWPGDCFYGAWGNGPGRQSRRWYLGAPGCHALPRPTLALGSTVGAVTALDGSTELVEAAEDGSTGVVAAEDGSTAAAMEAAVRGSIAGR